LKRSPSRQHAPNSAIFSEVHLGFLLVLRTQNGTFRGDPSEGPSYLPCGPTPKRPAKSSRRREGRGASAQGSASRLRSGRRTGQRDRVAHDSYRPRFPPIRYDGPRTRRGEPYEHRSMFATDGSHPDGPRGAENFKNRLETHTKTPPQNGCEGGRKRSYRPVRVETKASAIIRATDILLKRFNDRHRA